MFGGKNSLPNYMPGAELEAKLKPIRDDIRPLALGQRHGRNLSQGEKC